MKHIRKRFKLITSLVIIFAFLLPMLMPYNQIFANENGENISEVISKAQLRPYSKEYLEWVALPEEERKNTIAPPMHEMEYVAKETMMLMSTSTLPATYNLKNDINITIKNQGNTNQCWAFAAVSSLETNLAKAKGQNQSFSPRHMDYATSKTFTDGINSLGHNREVGDGGTALIAMAYLTRGAGPILETDMPFVNNEAKFALSYIANKTVQKKVTEYILFPSVKKEPGTSPNMTAFRENVKRHIMQYGSISTGIVYSDNFVVFNGNNLNVYCNDTNVKPNHGVSIVGWDDNYAVTNFKEGRRPQNPGAYIIRNSWDTNLYGSSYTGYDYVSYEDAYIEYSLLGIVGVENKDYDYIYQYDPLGCNNELTFDNKQIIYGANVFNKQSDKVQILNEVSLAVCLTNISYEIYVNPESGSLDAANLTKVATSSASLSPGYYTIKFDTPIYLTGDKFAVVVKYTCPGSAKAVLPVEYNDGSYWGTAKSNAGESFACFDLVSNNWEDLKGLEAPGIDIRDVNIAVKAFASDVSDNISIGSTLVTIKDNAGLPIAGATITVYENNVKRNSTLTTNAQGQVTIENMMAGKTYKIDIQKAGYIEQSGIQLQSITASGQVLTKQVNLTQNSGGNNNNNSNNNNNQKDDSAYKGNLPFVGETMVCFGVINILLAIAIINFRKIKALTGV